MSVFAYSSSEEEEEENFIPSHHNDSASNSNEPGDSESSDSDEDFAQSVKLKGHNNESASHSNVIEPGEFESSDSDEDFAPSDKSKGDQGHESLSSCYYNLSAVSRVPSGSFSLINRAVKGARSTQYIRLDVTQVTQYLADNNFSSLAQCEIESHKSKVKDGETDRETQFLNSLQRQGVQINTISKFLIMGQKKVGKKQIIAKHFLVFHNAHKPVNYSGDPRVSNTIVCYSLSSLTKMKKEFDAIRDALLRHQKTRHIPIQLSPKKEKRQRACVEDESFNIDLKRVSLQHDKLIKVLISFDDKLDSDTKEYKKLCGEQKALYSLNKEDYPEREQQKASQIYQLYENARVRLSMINAKFQKLSLEFRQEQDF